MYLSLYIFYIYVSRYKIVRCYDSFLLIYHFIFLYLKNWLLFQVVLFVLYYTYFSTYLLNT